MYGFLAPTGRFSAGANDNVGSGYWTHALSSGQTFYLTESKRLSLSAFQMYEFHTVQEGAGVHPGETFDLDYSLMYSPARTRRFQLQGGLAGYEQRQTTAEVHPCARASVPRPYCCDCGRHYRLMNHLSGRIQFLESLARVSAST